MYFIYIYRRMKCFFNSTNIDLCVVIYNFLTYTCDQHFYYILFLFIIKNILFCIVNVQQSELGRVACLPLFAVPLYIFRQYHYIRLVVIWGVAQLVCLMVWIAVAAVRGWHRFFFYIFLFGFIQCGKILLDGRHTIFLPYNCLFVQIKRYRMSWNGGGGGSTSAI